MASRLIPRRHFVCYTLAMGFIGTWLVLSLSLWVASKLLKNMKIEGGIGSVLIISAIFGLLTYFAGAALFALLGTITLGLGFLFAFITRVVVAAILLKVTDALTDRLTVKGFGTAIIAAIIMSGVGTLTEYVLTHHT